MKTRNSRADKLVPKSKPCDGGNFFRFQRSSGNDTDNDAAEVDFLLELLGLRRLYADTH